MKQLEVKKEITYRWWRNDNKQISSSHVALLNNDADARIAEMEALGYSSGELNAVYKNIEYSGWWEIKKGDLHIN